MTTMRISNKGQVTLPAEIRRRFGLTEQSSLEVEVRDAEIVIRPVKSVREVRGIFSEYARGKAADWETARRATEQAIAEEVANEGR